MGLRALITLSFAVIGAAAQTLLLNIPDAPPPGTQTLSGSFQGYSMEIASFADLAGNLSSPNKLSYRMLQNLKDISDAAVPIRVGGTTANHAVWIPNQEEAIVQNFATPGADQPANGTKYTVGVTFNSGKKGQDSSATEAKAFYNGIRKDLFAIEVGNEFDVYPVDRNLTTWSITQFVPEWVFRTSAIALRIFPKNNRRIYQAGTLVTPGTVSEDAS
ncbi:hypothetical protein E8E13_000650 [Curvularia kusanoi]|uniref:Glycoside hydrolase family 79 protein n=1 Tax=Curvularia kusanoi TaxID=90978 RepID=A0A9P4W1Q3_CURKU|nr:hypothetical protein E8E13_000650 [Curvularia kusanoi]